MDILFDDIDVDLRNRIIKKNNVAVLDLGLITIDSDDNIVLSDYDPEEDEENEEGEGEGEEQKEEKKNPVEQMDNIWDDLTDGIVEKMTEINEYERSHDPIFTVTSMEVTANSFNATVEVTDKDGLLTGDTLVEVIENSSNRAVYQNRLTDGETVFDVTTENFKP